MNHKIVLASNNKGKLAEFQALFLPLGITLINQRELGVGECDEPHPTFLENALRKARFASQYTGLPAIADDSGLVVPALGGEPGVLSARYAMTQGGEKTDAANNAYLLKALEQISDRRAYYVACLVYVRSENDACPLVAQGYWQGEIARQAMGKNGFGYDPYFYVPDMGKTVAQLENHEKNKISHRAQALKKLMDEWRI